MQFGFALQVLISTFSHISKLINTSFNPTWMRDYAKRLLDFLVTIGYDRPTLFHTFSGNCVCFSQILDLIATETVLYVNIFSTSNIQRYRYLKSLIIGQIYDSSPSEISTEGAIMSLTG
jgi:hypothetical protein